MRCRALGRTGWQVSEVSFGAWAIGGSWGAVSDGESLAALRKAIHCGVNFIDTADVYGEGRSERLIAQLKRERRDEIVVATKAGRRLSPHTADGYNAANLAGFVEDSLRNLATDCLDLVQLHCPPTDVYYRPEVFGALDDLAKAGKIRHYGVSVERVEEALKAIEFPNVQTVQIVFNCFRSGRRSCSFPRRGGAASASWRACLWPAGCSAASSRAIPGSPPTTIATSTVTARRSTWARHSLGWITAWPSKRWRRSEACFPPAWVWPPSRCAGF
jgi:diketogulonate reductase-like aldo/keto reductase